MDHIHRQKLPASNVSIRSTHLSPTAHHPTYIGIEQKLANLVYFRVSSFSRVFRGLRCDVFSHRVYFVQVKGALSQLKFRFCDGSSRRDGLANQSARASRTTNLAFSLRRCMGPPLSDLKIINGIV